MKKNTNKKGFTIVELVIVIAVIAILSAVLIPTFGSVINDANDAADLQAARNAYTEYLTTVDLTAGVPEIDYVVVNNKYYDVADEYNVVAEDDLADCYTKLVETDGTWGETDVHAENCAHTSNSEG